MWTWRYEFEARDAWEEARGGNTLICLWHGNLLLGLGGHRDQGLEVLVSPSGDGELIATLLPKFGYRVIRGSSNQRGTEALRILRSRLRDGRTGVVLTPDGPRGPRHSVNPGAPYLTSNGDVPLVVLGLAASRAWRLRSWDRFVLPKPGARIGLAYHRVAYRPGESLEAASARIGRELNSVEQRAQQLVAGVA